MNLFFTILIVTFSYTMGDISFDNSKSLCSADERTTGTCKCTGCGQIEVYMANFDRGITCIETAGSFSVNSVDGPICNTLYNTAVDAMAFGNYDEEPTCPSTTTSGTCKCTGAQQIDAYMTNYTKGETCIDNGDDTSSWSPAPSCDGSAVNTVICKCGTATCAAGYLCDVNNNQCSAPTCATQDGSAANNGVCQCGAETCAAGKFCDGGQCRDVATCDVINGSGVNNAVCQCGTETCAANLRCDKPNDLCFDVCTNKNGTVLNTEHCQCGTATCAADEFCDDSNNLCNTVVACAIQDGSAVNDNDCKCGLNNCDSSTGLFCDGGICGSVATCTAIDGSAANTVECKCGTETCGANLLCDANLNKCTDPVPDGYTATFDNSKPLCSATTTSGTCQCTGCGQIDVYMTNFDMGEGCIDNGDSTSTWSKLAPYAGTFDNSKPLCSATTSGTCKCTGCGQIEVYMTNLDNGEGCIDNGDSTSSWSKFAPYAGTFDNSKPLCSATTSGTCKCTGCGQIEVYMSNLDNGEGCIDNGDSTSSWSARASTAVHGTCEGFKCPSSFQLKTNPSQTSCTSFTCSERYDLNVCCDVTTNAAGIYGRTENNEEDCNDADLCPGCVNEFGKVLVKCKCLKHTDYKDYRTIIADTGDYCNKDGLWSKKTIEITGDSNDAANMKTQLIDTSIDGGEDGLHVETLNYFNSRTASQEAEDTMNYGYVEPVSGNGGKTYGCADKCIWNHKNERNIQIHDTRRLLSGFLRTFRLKRASVQNYDKSGTDVCKTESCALCTMCKVEAATKKYGFKPQVHKFIGLDGQISEYDAGCDATCENKGDDYDTTGRTLRISAPNGMVSMTKAQKEDNFANQKTVYSLDAAGTKGKILTINEQVGAITYIVADVTYTLDFKDNECLPTEFKIVSMEGSLSYHFTAQTLTFQAPVAGYDLKYYCQGKSLIGGIIKSHNPANIKKLRACNDAACSGCTSCNHLSGTDAVTSTYQPYADCTSETCQKAIDFFAPESPDEDTAGDGSRIGGGCKQWCEKAFYGIGQYWPSFRHEVENFAPDDIYDNVNAFREDKVCAWQRCSGCVRCKKRALNEEFAEKESLDDLGDTKYQRQKEALLGGCNMRGKTASDNCKLAWAAADANRKTELCSDRQASGLDCTGCKKCESEFGTATESAITVDKKSGANRAIDCPNARFCTEARSKQQKWIRRGCVPECINP